MKLFLSFIVWSINRIWPFAVLLFSVFVILIVLRIASRSKKIDLKAIFIASLIPTGIVIFLLVFFRNRITVPLIYHYGVESGGRVISSEVTNSVYNDQPVIKYNVIYKDKNGKTIDTSFRTSSFNVYPVKNSVRYPTTGSDFKLRYLEDFPTEFIIITDDKEEELRELYSQVSELKERLEFDPEDKTSQEELQVLEKEIQRIKEELENQ